MEEKFRTRWNVPYFVGAIDGKHIAIKKPKKTGNDYNYMGLFTIVLLALVDEKYRFLLIDCGTRGSCSDTQIFNRNDLREKIEDGSLGLLAPKPLEEKGPDLWYFLLCKDVFTLMPWSRIQLTREERIGYRVSRGRKVVENAFRILVGHFRVLLGNMEQRPRVVRDIVAQHAEDTTGQGRQAPNPGNDVACPVSKSDIP